MLSYLYAQFEFKKSKYIYEKSILSLVSNLRHFELEIYFSLCRLVMLQLDIGHLEFVQKTKNLV